MRRASIFLLFSLFIATGATAQTAVGPLTLDSSFAINGKAEIDFSGRDDSAMAFVSYLNIRTRVVTPVIVGGKIATSTPNKFHFGLTKYSSEGIPDATFGTNAKQEWSWTGIDYPHDLSLFPDGSLLAAGVAGNEPGLFRFKADGTPDSTFIGSTNEPGLVRSSTYLSGGEFQNVDTLQLFENGRWRMHYFAMGYQGGRFHAACTDSLGAFDQQFGSGGLAYGGSQIRFAQGHVMWPDSLHPFERILFVGLDTARTPEIVLCAMHTNGTLDSSFGTNGIKRTGVKLQGGSWLVSQAQHLFSGYYPPLQSSFSKGDLLVVAAPLEAAVDRPFSLIRFNIDGALDARFGAGGIASSLGLPKFRPRGITFSNEGAALLAGTQNEGLGIAAATKYFSSGVIDSSFGVNGLARLDPDFGARRNSFIGFVPVGGGAQTRHFSCIGESVDAISGSNIAIARYVPTPILKLSKTQLSFGNVDTGSVAVQSLDVTNYDVKTHSFDSAYANPSQFFSVVSPVGTFVLNPGSKVTITVSCHPHALISLNGTVNLNEHTGAQTSILISGQGVASLASVEKTSLSERPVLCFPNPATTWLTVRTPEQVSGECSLLDPLGREVSRLPLEAGQEHAMIDLRSLTSGVYYCVVRTPKRSYCERISVTR